MTVKYLIKILVNLAWMLGKTFIVVWEGVDGSGKTTLMNLVSRKLAEKGYAVEAHKTPSNSPTGIFAQEHGNKPDIDPLTRMLLFLANTTDDSTTIKKIINQKTPDFVMIDRYYHCSVVYGFSLISTKYKKEFDAEKFKIFFQTVEDLGEDVFVKPDLVVIVRVDPETRKRRAVLKPSSRDKELETDEELQTIVDKYYRMYSEWRPSKVIEVFNEDNMLEQLSSNLTDRLVALRRMSVGG